MPRRDLVRDGLRILIPAVGILAGCHQASPRHREHASASLLDTGPGTRVDARKAADVQIAVGRSQEAERHFAEAEAAYLAALAKDPKRADAEVRLAILADRAGDDAKADRHLARALKLAPRDPEILCDRGYSLYLRRRWADAESSLKQALAVDPSHARSHSNLALVLARRGDVEPALAEFARAGCDPSDARANLGLVLAMEGRLDESKQQYALALAAKPGSAVAKEGLKASTVALADAGRKRDLGAVAATARPADPAIRRASAAPAP